MFAFDASRQRFCFVLVCFVSLGLMLFTAGCGGSTHTSNGSGSGGSGGTGGSGGGASSPAAYVYVGTSALSQTGTPITGFAVATNGSAQPISGSPFSGASGSVVTTSAYVFATDDKNIATYSRNADGSLRQASSIDGTAHNLTPNDSAVTSLSLDRSGQTLYVGELNYDSTGNNAYSYFAIGSGGALSFLSSSQIDANFHAPLVFSQNNQYAYGEGCYHLGWELFGFARNPDGTLTPLDTMAQLPPPNNPDTMYCPSDSAVSAKNYLALVYRDLSVQDGTYMLATYAINPDGTLGLVLNSEITTAFTGENEVAFDPTGTFLAVAGDNGIQVYQLASSGMLTAVGNVQQAGVTFLSLRWDSSNHLYAISNSALYIFSSNQGTLTLVGSPYPVTNAGSLAVLPGS